MSALQEAAALLSAEAQRLTGMIRAKGYPKVSVELWVRPVGLTHQVFVDDRPREMSFVMPGMDLAETIARTEQAIAEMPDVTGYAAWFAWPQADAAE